MSDSKEDHTGMALEEALAWEKYDGPKVNGGIGAALSPVFGRPVKSIRLRHQLFRAGSAAAPLWGRIEKGMTLYTAVRILQAAGSEFHRQNPGWKAADHPSGDAIKKFVDDELAAYDASPWQEVESPNGGFFKRRKGEKKKEVDAGPDTDPSPVPTPTPEPGPAPQAEQIPGSEQDQAESGDSPSGSHWAKIKQALEGLLDEKAPGLDPADRDQIRMEFDVEVRRSMTWLRSRVSVASKLSKGLPILVVRRDVTRWCSVLNIDPPRGGAPVDPEVLRRQFRAMSKAYHPDRNPGVAEMAEKMRDVSQAYHGLLGYNASREKE